MILYTHEDATIFLDDKFDREVGLKAGVTADEIEDICDETFGTFFEQEARTGLVEWCWP